MALFDKILKGVGAVVSNIDTEKISNGVSNAVSAAKDGLSKLDEKKPEVAAPAAKPSEPELQKAEPVVEVDCATKIRNVLAGQFPLYQVQENVSPVTIGGTGRFMNYSFGVYQMGVPKLFIMLIGKTTCSHREYRWAKEQAAKAGVPMINFIVHYPNEISYITNRLHQYL